ncbi:MAG: hypothetical protein GY910_05655 [bacterium]|nr:hypothetical protein [Deltaproteobacteria bacterium]MCP4904446.1 hypothetical protein [bacterium]
MKRDKFISHFGPWAVETGASSGIGTGFAEQLVAAVFNYMLAERYDRSPERIAGIVVVSTVLSASALPLLLPFLL